MFIHSFLGSCPLHLALLFSLLALAFLRTRPRSFLTDDLVAARKFFFNTIPVRQKQPNEINLMHVNCMVVDMFVTSI